MNNNLSPRWQIYIIPDLKTWSTDVRAQTPIERYANPTDALRRFQELRTAPYNRIDTDFTVNGVPYAHLTLGIERVDGHRAVDVLQVRGDQNTLITDFSTSNYTRQDAEVLHLVARVADEIGFTHVMTCSSKRVNGVVPTVILPFDEWNSPYFMDIVPASWFERKENRFMESDNAYAFYQLKEGDELHGLRFESYERARDVIDKANYQIIYTGALPKTDTLSQQLDALFQQFNANYPRDFHGRSMSVSDVIAVRQNGVLSAHYVDSIGFAELPGFYSDKNPLRSLEDMVEQNDNQLDGIINNLPSQPAPKVKPTIQEQLRAAKEVLKNQVRHQKKTSTRGEEER